MRLEDQQIKSSFNTAVAASLQRIRSGNAQVQRDSEGSIIPPPSNLPPNAARELMPESQSPYGWD